MPQKTKAEREYKVYTQAQRIFIAANLLDGNIPADLHPDFDNNVPDSADQSGLREFRNAEAAAMLRYVGATWLDLAHSLSSDGTYGPYFQFQRPTDLFECCLRMPDHYFRSVFWCVTLQLSLECMFTFNNSVGRDMFEKLIAVLGHNPIFCSKGCKPQCHV